MERMGGLENDLKSLLDEHGEQAVLKGDKFS